jgi:hypothetical protein
MVRGPTCVGYASSVHHIVASSERPDLFWAEENLVASCGPCNYGGGARIAASNTKATIASLQQIVEQQEQRIEMLLDRLAQLERAAQPQSRIY